MNKIQKKIIYIISILILTIPSPVLALCSQYCEDIAPAIRILKYGMIPLFQIIIPIALILMGMIDFAKAMMSGKEEEMKKNQSKFIKRCIYGISVFLVISIVTLVMGLFKSTGANKEIKGTEDWWKCYNSVDECNDNEEEIEEDNNKTEEEIIIID